MSHPLLAGELGLHRPGHTRLGRDAAGGGSFIIFNYIPVNGDAAIGAHRGAKGATGAFV
jgi:hypothetical protein